MLDLALITFSSFFGFFLTNSTLSFIFITSLLDQLLGLDLLLVSFDAFCALKIHND
jgi:hypothetical protein